MLPAATKQHAMFWFGDRFSHHATPDTSAQLPAPSHRMDPRPRYARQRPPGVGANIHLGGGAHRDSMPCDPARPL